MHCLDLNNFSIGETMRNMSVDMYKTRCVVKGWRFMYINGFLFIDQGWVYHESIDKLEELVELYRLTGCNMELAANYDDGQRKYNFRLSTCVDLVKLMDTI